MTGPKIIGVHHRQSLHGLVVQKQHQGLSAIIPGHPGIAHIGAQWIHIHQSWYQPSQNDDLRETANLLHLWFDAQPNDTTSAAKLAAELSTE